MSASTHPHPHQLDDGHTQAQVIDPEVAQLGPSDPGSVVLDIGGAAGTRWARIFSPLPEGDYTVWNLDGTAHEIATIVAGEVTQTDRR